MTESKIRSATEEAKSIPRLIVLDDNPGWGHFIAEVAEKTGYAASYTTSHSEYFGATAYDPPDVLVLDLFNDTKARSSYSSAAKVMRC